MSAVAEQPLPKPVVRAKTNSNQLLHHQLQHANNIQVEELSELDCEYLDSIHKHTWTVFKDIPGPR